MAAYGLYTHIAANKTRSMLLLGGLFVLVYVMVYAGALIAEVMTYGAGAPADIGAVLVLQAAYRDDDAGVGDIRPVGRNRCARLCASLGGAGRCDMQSKGCGDAR